MDPKERKKKLLMKKLIQKLREKTRSKISDPELFLFSIDLLMFAEMLASRTDPESVNAKNRDPEPLKKEKEAEERFEFYLSSVAYVVEQEKRYLHDRIKNDERSLRLFEEYLFGNFMARLFDLTEHVSCSNCEDFVDCKLGPMVRNLEVKRGLNEYFRKVAKECERYVPSDVVSEYDWWKKNVESVKNLCSKYGFPVREEIFLRMEDEARKRIDHFLAMAKGIVKSRQ